MAFREKDYLKRQIEMFAQLLARVFGVRAAGRPDEALEEMRRGAGTVLGLEYDTLARVDAATARMLLRDPELIDAYAQMLELEADLAASAGAAAGAAGPSAGAGGPAAGPANPDASRAESLRARARAIREG